LCKQNIQQLNNINGHKNKYFNNNPQTSQNPSNIQLLALLKKKKRNDELKYVSIQFQLTVKRRSVVPSSGQALLQQFGVGQNLGRRSSEEVVVLLVRRARGVHLGMGSSLFKVRERTQRAKGTRGRSKGQFRMVTSKR